MAKTFALEEATAPVISVVGVAGGSLVEGTTYSVCVCGTFGISNYYNLGYGRQISAPSNTVTFTATAVNKSFEITIDTPSTGVTAIQLYIMYFYADTDADPDFYPTTATGVAKNNVWGKDNGGNVYCYYGQPAANFPKTIDEDDRLDPYTVAPFFMQGQPELQMYGGDYADPIIPENIWDYLVGLGGGEEKYMDKVGDCTKIGVKRCMGYQIHLQIYVLSTSTTHFNIPDREICIFTVPQSLSYADQFYTGNMAADGVSHTGDYPTGGGTLYFLGRSGRYNTLNNTSIYNGVVNNAPASVYEGFYGRHLSSAHLYQYRTSYIEDSNINAYYYFTGSYRVTWKRLNFPGVATNAIGIYPGSVVEDIKLYGYIRSSYLSSRNDVTMYQVNQVYNSGTYDMRMLHYADNDLNFRFFDSHHCSGTLTASEIYLRTRWSAGWVGANLKVHNGFRLNVHVEEADGTVVEGATVVLTDAYGTSTIDTTTDASGDITRTDVAKNIWTVTIPNTDAEWGGPSNYKTYSWLLASYPDVCDFKLYAPFTLTITKAGKGVYKAILDPDQDDWFPAGINLRVTLPRAGFETKILDSTIYDSTIY